MSKKQQVVVMPRYQLRPVPTPLPSVETYPCRRCGQPRVRAYINSEYDGVFCTNTNMCPKAHVPGDYIRRREKVEAPLLKAALKWE